MKINSKFPGEKLSFIVDRAMEEREVRIRKDRAELARLKRIKTSFKKPETANLDLSIDMFGITPSTVRCLKEAGLMNLKRIANMSDSEWTVLKSFGGKHYPEVRDLMRSLGFDVPIGS